MVSACRHRHPSEPAKLPPTLAPAYTAYLSGLLLAFIGHRRILDLLRDDGARYAELLSAAGVPVELYNAPTLMHGFVHFALVVPRRRRRDQPRSGGVGRPRCTGGMIRAVRCSTRGTSAAVGGLAGAQSRHGRRDLAAAAEQERTRGAGMSYGEAVEIALCFGWIDSLARGHDDVSRIQRFSPRKPKSGWSKSNVERVQRLVAAGRMREPGQRQIDAAKLDGRWPS